MTQQHDDTTYISRFERLAERLDTEAEKWIHEPGDKLLGEVLDVDTFVGDKGYEPCPMLTIEAAEGSTEEGKPIPAGEERIFYASRTVARSELEKASPRVGEEIGIKYVGIPDGKEYHGYRIRVLTARRPVVTEEPASTETELGEELASDFSATAGDEPENGIPF